LYVRIWHDEQMSLQTPAKGVQWWRWCNLRWQTVPDLGTSNRKASVTNGGPVGLWLDEAMIWTSLHQFSNPDLKHSSRQVPTTNHSVSAYDTPNRLTYGVFLNLFTYLHIITANSRLTPTVYLGCCCCLRVVSVYLWRSKSLLFSCCVAVASRCWLKLSPSWPFRDQCHIT